ncbi:hypothetical protein V7796_17805 [Rhizobium laguerreae]|uniref:hypothetical protein n=1 Tax=Rhizobium leguminosarum TaxID=384 RepID=UPI0021BBBEE2|nr:hypothetical protein [Rhizobium leguminosarum]
MTISSAARGAGCPPNTPHLQLNGRETPKFPSPIQRTFQEEAVLTADKNHHRHYPARVAVLKTSRFRDEEENGIVEALDPAGTEMKDLVWVQESSSVKVLRDGNYPVMRGTFFTGVDINAVAIANWFSVFNDPQQA